MPDTANDIEQTRQQIYDAVEAMPEEAVRRLWRVLYDWLRLHPLSCVLLVSLGVEGAFF
jgi:hypothetical protein